MGAGWLRKLDWWARDMDKPIKSIGKKDKRLAFHRPARNRNYLGRIPKGKKVSTPFCLFLSFFSPGFAKMALPECFNSVDISIQAIELTERKSWLERHIQGKHSLKWLMCENISGKIWPKSYDVIVPGSPAFAKPTKLDTNAVQAYKRIEWGSLKKIKSGGFYIYLFCSQVVR